MDPFVATALFFGAMLLDAVGAVYTIAVAKRRAAVAAITVGIEYGLLALGILQFLENPAYLLPALVGGMIGAFLIVKYFPEAT